MAKKLSLLLPGPSTMVQNILLTGNSYISILAEPVGNVDSGAFWGSFIGLIFLAASYVSIGTFASSLSKNQIVAFVLAIVISFFFYYGFEVLTSFITAGQTIQVFETLGIHAHYKSMSRGVIASRDLLYFIVISSGFLAATVWKIRKWFFLFYQIYNLALWIQI